MAGMWELPEIAPSRDRKQLLFRIKHSITVTDYSVEIWAVSESRELSGQWCAIERLPRLALTGLTRKVLRRGGIFPASG